MAKQTTMDLKKRPANDNRSRRTRKHTARELPTPIDKRARARAQAVTWAPAILATFFGIGCGPDFDPSSLVESTRVVGARVEVMGAPDRASPAPGEMATATWFVTAPAATPPLAWAFALCLPAPLGALGCDGAPLATFTGTDTPRMTFTAPAAAALRGGAHLALYGRVCASSDPVFDPTSGQPSCSGGGAGTTATLSILLATAGDASANHNPTAERGFTFDGQPWPAGTDPCVAGPRVASDELAHELGFSTVGADRETYTANVGDPPAPTSVREALQVSLFATEGKLKSPFAFVEAADARDTTPLTMKWTAPKVGAVTVDTPVTFTFVVRDDRGGADWTTRAACVAGS